MLEFFLALSLCTTSSKVAVLPGIADSGYACPESEKKSNDTILQEEHLWFYSTALSFQRQISSHFLTPLSSLRPVQGGTV